MITELKSFEAIKQLTEHGMEYWSARDLQKSLGYEKWDNFSKVIDKAMLACDVAGFDVKDHFPVVRKIVDMPSKTREKNKLHSDNLIIISTVFQKKLYLCNIKFVTKKVLFCYKIKI